MGQPMADESKRKGLGRGLSALIGDDTAETAHGAVSRGLREIPIEFLRPNPFQPRHDFDEGKIAELAESIREKGIIQPIVVRPVAGETDAYEIVAGERRWRAAQRALLHEVPVVIKEIDDGEALEIAIIENVQRADLNPVEEAEGYERLMSEFRHTQDQVAQIVGKSRSHVANTLRLLTLPDDVKAMLGDGRLSAGHGRALTVADNPAALAKRIVEKGLNVRQVEEAVRGGTKSKSRRKPQETAKDADTIALERDLSSALGLTVEVVYKGDEGGEVRIRYRSLDQLDEICQRLTHRHDGSAGGSND